MSSPNHRPRAARAASLLALALSLPAPLPAQTLDSLPAGARVRIRQPAYGTGWLVGRLVSPAADSAAIALAGRPDTVRFATDSLPPLQVSQGLRARTGKGALVGLGVGAGTGLILGILAAAEDCTGFCVIDVGPAEIAGVSALLGGVGAGIGALVGSLVRGERWRPVHPPPRGGVRLQPVVGAGRVGVAVLF